MPGLQILLFLSYYVKTNRGGGGDYAPTQGLGLRTKWLWVRIPLLSVSILFYNSFESIKLLYTFLVISFAQYKEYMICLISFDKF